MGRPPTYTTAQFLGAAAELFAEGGARAVTMAAAAKAAGAPNGSIYHRFADRPALLAALWTTNLRDFQDDFIALLGPAPTVDDAVAAAASVVHWCRRHPAGARVLDAGKQAFSPTEWTPEATAVLARAENELKAALKRATLTLSDPPGRTVDDVVLALVEVPRAVVHRYLSSGRTPPPKAADLVTRSVRKLLHP
ncbi:TetR/AcrR family transcriptional regulator [Amycolatopsis sp. FDAARGOS 1241]|uniref:TetR/AcrR family transcriptional regulator n=1 Tax=Amycolatopsis sp. FDAARGOS 1241 TaxID=2778070 RepID=UPI001951A016|nr:TetR/AcrR family transcriptional regulator [Amycolatopsis sp. FDAARGOS 1241]QRP44400.1 TetR/AcrR family transcriptional regulator [Amycolatopsis sp. FDAARGOS 1241]